MGERKEGGLLLGERKEGLLLHLWGMVSSTQALRVEKRVYEMVSQGQSHDID